MEKWTEIKELVTAHFAAEEEIFRVHLIEQMGNERLEEMEEKVRNIQKSMHCGYLVLPLLLWEAEEEEYEALWRKQLPAFVRKVVVGQIMFLQGAKEMAPICLNVRSTWNA